MITIKKMRHAAAFAVIAMGLAFSSAANATTYSQLVVFGDSLSDSGNIFDLFGGAFGPNPPYAEGRFTSDYTNGDSGLVWVEHLADLMGLSLDNSVAGGTNYAFGGAQATETPSDLIPSLPDQATSYLSSTGGVADDSALYVVFGGGNDVRDNEISMSVASIAGIISDLASAGAVNFFVPNLPDIGLTPESQAGDAPGGSAAVISAASAAFNADLAVTLASLEMSLGINIINFDLNSIFSSIIADPGAFGIANVTDSCFDGFAACADPDTYLFFDGIHPTALVHELMGQLAYAELRPVPVPAALPLMLSALGFLGLRRRRNA